MTPTPGRFLAQRLPAEHRAEGSLASQDGLRSKTQAWTGNS